MAQRHPGITPALRAFIEAQKVFFVGTATADGRVNVSPKGLDGLRVTGEHTVHWLNFTGSGNETAAHVIENPRMTLMFCAFEGKPQILRLYGVARSIGPGSSEWEASLTRFIPSPGARQIFELCVDLVVTSCGMGVPLYTYQGQRPGLVEWAERKGRDGIIEYQRRKNHTSLDGKPTDITGE